MYTYARVCVYIYICIYIYIYTYIHTMYVEEPRQGGHPLRRPGLAGVRARWQRAVSSLHCDITTRHYDSSTL